VPFPKKGLAVRRWLIFARWAPRISEGCFRSLNLQFADLLISDLISASFVFNNLTGSVFHRASYLPFFHRPDRVILQCCLLRPFVFTDLTGSSHFATVRSQSFFPNFFWSGLFSGSRNDNTTETESTLQRQADARPVVLGFPASVLEAIRILFQYISCNGTIVKRKMRCRSWCP
jgi:hypothetical protein